MGFKKEVLTKLSAIDTQLALNNQILGEHHKRSTQLEARVAPLEHAHIFTNKLLKMLLSLTALIAALASAYHYIFKV